MGTMNTNFADWYRMAGIDPDQELLQLRWSGIETFTTDCSADDALELVRLYLGARAPSGSFIDSFRAAFKGVDEAFPMRSNDLELQVLAGSVLFHLLESPGGVSDIAALTLNTGTCSGQIKPIVLGELVPHAVEYLAGRCTAVRALRPLADIPKAKRASINEPQFSGSDVSVVAGPVTEVVGHLYTSIDSLGSAANKALRNLLDRQEALEEELDILWWLQGSYSGDLKARLASLPIAGGALVVAKELADHTCRTPGVPAARPILDKALRCVRPKPPAKITLKEAVNDTSHEWREHVSDHGLDRLRELTPVLLALAKSRETDGVDEWLPAFQKAALVEPTWSVSPLDVATQLYGELMLQRAYRDEQE